MNGDLKGRHQPRSYAVLAFHTGDSTKNWSKVPPCRWNRIWLDPIRRSASRDESLVSRHREARFPRYASSATVTWLTSPNCSRYIVGRLTPFSRVTFFNSRARQLDRNTGSTSLVVADGDSAFLRAIDAREFQQSDVVGVIHRTVERDRLESIGTKLADLSQWYVPDGNVLDPVPQPRGITVSVLQGRRS